MTPPLLPRTSGKDGTPDHEPQKTNAMNYYPGFDISPTATPMGFHYGEEVFGPEVENRRLEAIRPSLLDPHCEGPDPVYAIAMDVGKRRHRPMLERMHLLFGAVTYAAGTLGQEPVRSQGHIHAISPLSGWSTPEVYEIWEGRAVIYMQERAEDTPGRCFAVQAGPGEVVIVPPGWAHATVSADPRTPLTFGAWCDRAYGFDYRGVRAHKGLAWFPTLGNGTLHWTANPRYTPSELVCKSPGDYTALGIRPGEPIYTTFERAPETFLYVPHPETKAAVWEHFIP